jgi:hypothetical protein
MRINVVIERLVLEGLPHDLNAGPVIEHALQTKLAALLAVERFGGSLKSGSRPSVRTADVQLPGGVGPGDFGRRIAGAVHQEIGR